MLKTLYFHIYVEYEIHPHSHRFKLKPVALKCSRMEEMTSWDHAVSALAVVQSQNSAYSICSYIHYFNTGLSQVNACCATPQWTSLKPIYSYPVLKYVIPMLNTFIQLCSKLRWHDLLYSDLVWQINSIIICISVSCTTNLHDGTHQNNIICYCIRLLKITKSNTLHNILAYKTNHLLSWTGEWQFYYFGQSLSYSPST